MKAPGAWREGYTGEFETEIALPVRVVFAVDSSGLIELAHVRFAEEANFVEGRAKLLWERLPQAIRRDLLEEARREARD